MGTLAQLYIIAILISHGLLLIYTFWRRNQQREGFYWTLAGSILAAAASAVYFLPEDWLLANSLGRVFPLTLLLSGTLIAFGGLILGDMDYHQPRPITRRIWLVFSALWPILYAVLAFSNNNGEPYTGVFDAGATPQAIVALGGAALGGIFLIAVGFINFWAANIPEVANRALYWTLGVGIMLLGIALMTTGELIPAMLGMAVLLLGIAGAVNGYTSYRVFDIRASISTILRTLILTVGTGAVIFGAMYLVNGLELSSDLQDALVLGVLALIIAAIYVPARQILEMLFRRLILPKRANPALVTREYAQRVATAQDLKSLAVIATDALNQLMGIRRSTIILVNGTSSDENEIELLIMPNKENGKEQRASLRRGGPIFRILAGNRRPITQFDIEYDPECREVAVSELDFLRSLGMHAYAPITIEGVFAGILAAGPKTDDTAYTEQDLDLLLTLSHQVGIALRNARLIDDLKHLNDTMRSLNTGLQSTKEELEKLDAVKTDFITVASHELRTPLAQLRGYTDILDALNEQGMLDQDQTQGLVANLRKATERMEELIGAMLDMSQLDINAMDLRFAQTTVESVLRMAIEPLADNIKQRKLTLTVRGARGLPPIQADLQRLVQAFRNLIINAIKFTPDGGRIDIRASLYESDNVEEAKHILVEIQDTGVGIKKSDLSLIFKKFYRGYDPSLHSTGTYKFLGAGPGLGLTIAKGVIEGHGGKIWAESPGHDLKGTPGATFYVLLPLTPPEGAKRVMPFEAASDFEKNTSPHLPSARKETTPRR